MEEATTKSGNVLSGSPIQIEINGKTYEVKQHPRRIQRSARARLLEVTDMVAQLDGDDLTDIGRAAAIIDTVDALLDFCLEFVPAVAEDIDAIEEYIEGDGMQGVTVMLDCLFTPLYKAWLEPWLSGVEQSGKQ